MKNILAITAALILLISLSACGLDGNEPESISGGLDGIVGRIENHQITPDRRLVGERNDIDDSYAGSYTAQCCGQTGRDVIFAGGVLQDRKVRVYGHVFKESGTAVVRIVSGAIATEIEIDENGNFEGTLDLTSAANSIEISYRNFTGRVELTSEYCSVRKI